MNDAKSNPWAEVERLQIENANLKQQVDLLVRSMERDEKSARERSAGFFVVAAALDKALAQLAATEEALRQVQRESAALRAKYETQVYRATVFADTAFEAKYEAARKVADASAKYHRAFTSPVEVEEEIERLGRLWEVAVREYLALAEPPAISPVAVMNAIAAGQHRAVTAPDPCPFKFDDPDPPARIGEPCALGHDNPNMRDENAVLLKDAFPPGFDVKRSEKGLAQEGGDAEIGRNEAETGQGSIFGR